VDDRNPSSTFMIAGVVVAFVLALASATVLYPSLQLHNRIAETATITVTQMQPAQLVDITSGNPEETNARAAANRLLAESLIRQAIQMAQANQQAQSAQAPAQATPHANGANAASTSPAAVAAQSVVAAESAESQPTGSTQTALLQPKAETSVQNNDISAPPPVEAQKVDAAPPAAAAAATLSAEETQRSRARAWSMIQQGDITSARLELERLARFGDARAVFALAETFDPRMLAQWKVRGMTPDPARANTLYSQAAKAGIGEARDRLTELGN
jgi:hypothetical protein